MESSSPPFPPSTPLSEVSWVPRPKITPLARLGLETLADLATHYPRRMEDRRKFDRFPDEEMDRPVCLFGVVARTAMKRLGGWRRMFEAVLENETGSILSQPLTCRWFNMPFVQKMIMSGQRMVVYGRPKKRGRQIVIDHPEFEIIDEEEDVSIHLNRITPVHPAGDGVSPRVLRSLIHRALQEMDLFSFPSLLPDAGPTQASALRDIHFPESLEDFERARQQLVREEFLSIQLIIASRRSAWTRLDGAAKDAPGALLARLLAALPFALTNAQRTAIEEIRGDLAASRRMNRLLQGDVGSGKTLVALAAMLLTIESGWAAAIMAPTQILAEQHYLNFKRLLEPLGIGVSLRMNSRRENTAPMPLFTGSQESSPEIIVGTHALLYENEGLPNLGLVVIDEQHKFGVLQRARLIERGDSPDVLVMTATPIPRTLTQTLYGDLDVSLMREKPARRGPIQTVARDFSKLPEVTDFMRKHLGKQRQAYIVYPLVEESDKLAAKSATAEYEKWKALLAPHEVGLIHGRLAPEEKEAVMKRFRDGEIAALVSTTVIEVGVDVPNATLMLVENAERFGLAQLHQLRGRIGRGEHKSYCILLHDKAAPEDAVGKLTVLEKTSDGFEIAEADLRLRGPGDLLGTAQTGLPPLKLGDLFRDAEVMTEARRAAQDIFLRDPDLSDPRHAAIRRLIERTAKRALAATG